MFVDAQPANHSLVADWVKPLVGVVLGFLLSFVSGFVADWKKRRGMRRALYAELLETYRDIRLLVKGEGGKTFDDDTVFTVMNVQWLDAYEHAKRNPDVFYFLQEAHTLDYTFGTFRWIKENRNKTNANNLREDAEAILHYIQDALEHGRFNRRLLKSIAPDVLEDIDEDLASRKLRVTKAADSPQG